MAKSGHNSGKRQRTNAGTAGQSESPSAHQSKSFTRSLIQSATLLVLGAAVACLVMSVSQPVAGRGMDGAATSNALKPVANTSGPRTVWQLLALSDAELERVDVVELNLAVAREIPGLEDLDIPKYQRIVDTWAAAIRHEMPAGEIAFHKTPEKWQNDIRFFRLGVMSGYLDQSLGIAYIDEQKQAQIEARKQGRMAEVLYTNPSDLFLHGLIDTKRGTCGSMPALHVALGRRLGWPVSLSPVASHTVCRFDDGQVVYNIETTHTDQGGMFSAGTDEDYIKEFKIPRRAIAHGSDLHSMTARQMLGYFIMMRGRHYADTGRYDLADQDYALARSLLPNHRVLLMSSMDAAIRRSGRLFTPNEQGHPIGLAMWLNAQLQPHQASGHAEMDARIAEVERINAANQRRFMNPVAPGIHQPNDPHAGWPKPNFPNPAIPGTTTHPHHTGY